MRSKNLSVVDAAVECAEIISDFSPPNKAKIVLVLLQLALRNRTRLILEVLDNANLQFKDVKPEKGRWFNWLWRTNNKGITHGS